MLWTSCARVCELGCLCVCADYCENSKANIRRVTTAMCTKIRYANIIWICLFSHQKNRRLLHTIRNGGSTQNTSQNKNNSHTHTHTHLPTTQWPKIESANQKLLFMDLVAQKAKNLKININLSQSLFSFDTISSLNRLSNAFALFSREQQNLVYTRNAKSTALPFSFEHCSAYGVRIQFYVCVLFSSLFISAY